MNTHPTSKTLTENRLTARRHFTKNLIAVGTLAAVLPLNSFAQERQAGRVFKVDAPVLTENVARELKTNRRSTFQSVLSDYFQTTNGMGTALSLLLLEINDLPEQHKQLAEQKLSVAREKELRENSFALIFRGPLEIPLQQNIYKLKHPVLGEVNIFLVPVGKVSKDAAGRDYEAVFNRMTE